MQNLIIACHQPTLWNNASNASAVDATATAPDGTMTAARIYATGAGNINHFREQVNVSLPTTHPAGSTRVKCASVYVKAGTTTKVVVGDGRHSNWYRALFVLSGAGSVDFNENCIATFIENVGDGWYRCSVVHALLPGDVNNAGQASVMVAPVPAAQTGIATISYSQTGEDVYVWGAQLSFTKGPIALAVTTTKVVDGRTRARSPLQNLLLYSEDFANAAWFKESAAVTITSNAGTAPNGTATADRIQWTSGALRYVGQTITFQARTHNLCVWVRSNNGSSQKIRLRLPSQVGVSNQDSPGIVVGTAWQRVSLTVNNSAAGSSTFLIESDVANSAVDLLVWGAQLSHANGMPTYVPTTNTLVDQGAPRSEPQRSQILFDTENLTAGSWTPIGTDGRTLLAGQGLGGGNATRLDDASGVEYRGVYQSRSVPADLRSYTLSVDVAKTSTTPSFGVNFTLSGGTVVSMTPRLRPSDGAFAQAWFTSSAWAYVEDLGTHWRVHAVIHNNGTNTTIQASLYAAAGGVYTADSVGGIGYADVGRVSLTATKGPVEYVANNNSGGIGFDSVVGNARGRRIRQNLVQISNLNNAAWNVGGAVRSVGPVLPGGRTGITLTEDATAGVAHYTDQTIVPSLLPGRRYTVAVTFKQGSAGRPWCVIGANGGGVSGWLNSTTGQIQNPSPGGQMRARQLDATTWRAYFTFTADTLPTIRLYLAASYGAAVYNGDGTSFAHYGDVSVTEGSGEVEFAESTRAIQGAVNEGLGGPRSLIGRQNTLVSPYDFGGAAWSRSQATIDAVLVAGPDGTTTARKLIDNANNSLHYVTQASLDPLNFNGVTYGRAGMRTWHVYAKAGTLSGLIVAFDNTNQGAYFDLALGLVALPFCVPGGFAECRPVSGSPGWYKCSVTSDVSVSGALNIIIATSPDPYAPIGAYVGSGGSILIWGAGLSAAGGATADQFDIPVISGGSQVTAGYPRALVG